MYVINPFSSDKNKQIHKEVIKHKIRTETEIREFLYGQYSEEEINDYLDYGYLEKTRERLSPKPINATLKTTLIFFLGLIFLAIHYLLFDEAEFFRNVDKLDNHNPNAALIYSVFYGALFYLSLLLGWTYIILALYRVLKKVFKID